MEYMVEKEGFDVCEKVFEGAKEQPVDIELSLPDYCPDVERILKCRMSAGITSKSITGDRLDVEGSITLRLYYLDSKKRNLRFCEHSAPFSCSFNIKNADSECVSRVRTRNEYLNCRAVSPRKLDIHGAFSVMAAVYKSVPSEIVTYMDGDDIQQRSHTVRISDLRGCSGQQFSLSEVLDIGSGKGTPETILRSELNILTDECRAIEDKLMLKGEAVLKILYLTDLETGTRDTMTFHIPLSQIIDVRGINENTVNDVSVDVMSYDVSLRSEYDEGSTLVALDARLCANVFAYEQKDITVIDDAYSTIYDLKPVYQNENLFRVMPCCRMIQNVTASMTAGDRNVSEVIDVWLDSVSSITETDQSGISIKAKLNICMLVQDKDGQPFCIEKAADICFVPECIDLYNKQTVSYSLSAADISFRIVDDTTVEVKAAVRLDAFISSTEQCRCIISASADEDALRENDKTAALTIYYADSGEDIWDIARSYCTTPESLRLENDLENDILHGGEMLVVS